MKFYKPIFFFTNLFFVAAVWAQENASIKSSIDKNKILVGERFTLTITISFPAGATNSFLLDSIESFEILESKIDTTITEKEITLRGEYKLTSFDSGHHVIPSFHLASKIKTGTLPIDVVFSDFDPKQDYHDIKDVIAVEEKQKKEWWYAAAAAILLIALLIWALVRKRKTLPKGNEEIRTDPFQEAMQHLSKLEGSNYPAKQFHSELTDIFRLYVFRKKNILSLQETTGDLLVQLKDLNLEKVLFENLSQSLRLCDFVKFAKYLPSAEDNKNAFGIIKKSIESIENHVV